MEERKQRLIIDGNAFYELDLDCVRRKDRQRKDDNRRRGDTGKGRKNNARRQ